MIHLSGRRLRSGLFCAVLSLLSAATVKADRFAYMGGEDGSFGAINLQTGGYTLLGNSEKTLFGLGVANGLLFATTYDDAAPLYTVNPSNSALTFACRSFRGGSDSGTIDWIACRIFGCHAAIRVATEDARPVLLKKLSSPSASVRCDRLRPSGQGVSRARVSVPARRVSL